MWSIFRLLSTQFGLHIEIYAKLNANYSCGNGNKLQTFNAFRHNSFPLSSLEPKDKISWFNIYCKIPMHFSCIYSWSLFFFFSNFLVTSAKLIDIFCQKSLLFRIHRKCGKNFFFFHFSNSVHCLTTFTKSEWVHLFHLLDYFIQWKIRKLFVC